MNIYTDASFSWQRYIDTDDKIIKGKVCIIAEDSIESPFNIIEEVGIGRVDKLKQYINILELIAITRAIEIAGEKGWGNINVITDSSVAKTWATRGIRASLFTEAHRSCQEYFNKAKAGHKGRVEIMHVVRDKNPAGKLLEIEKENEQYKG